MTLQERLRVKAKWVSSRIADLLDEAADALDARDAEIAELKRAPETTRTFMEMREAYEKAYLAMLAE